MSGDVCRLLNEVKAPIAVVLCGEGPARTSLEASCVGLSNARFLLLQPMARLNEFLNTADIDLLPQRREAADLVLPSKLTGMLASGAAGCCDGCAGNRGWRLKSMGVALLPMPQPRQWRQAS